MTLRLLSIILLLSGCSHTVVTKTIYPEIILTPREPVPSIAKEELECLTNDTYKKLVIQKNIRNRRIEELELIIDKINQQHVKGVGNE